MQPYTKERLAPVARQIFGEMRYGIGDPPAYDLMKTILRCSLERWETEFKASFIANFPGQDPELTRQAVEYLLGHFDETLQENQEVHIRESDRRKFGFDQ